MRNEADALTGDDVDDEPGAPDPSDPTSDEPIDAEIDDDDDWDDDEDWDDEDVVSSSPYPDSPYPDSPYPDAAGGEADRDDTRISGPYPDQRADELDPLFRGHPDDFEFARPDGPQAGAGDVFVLDEPPPAVPYRPRRMSRLERRRRVRLQARRVRRIIRHIEPWSVLKISLFFWACLWVIFLVAGFMIWGVAESSGTIGKLEDLLTELFQLEEFEFDKGQIFRGYTLAGLAVSIAGTTFNVLMCLLFNLISDLTGGLRITMIEEETARPAPPRRARRRRPPVRR